jgi:hypothetical protein
VISIPLTILSSGITSDMGCYRQQSEATIQNGKNLTDLQFTILNGMADDYEDVEQLYLYANEDSGERFPLRIIIDEIANMLREGYIVAKYSNNEQFAPLYPLNLSALHHYWLGATDKGTQYWKAYLATKA